MRRGVFAACAGAIVGVALLQSVVHLAVVLDADRVGTVVDLDRSNGLPDLVSTVALDGRRRRARSCSHGDERGERRIAPTLLTAVLALLTLADLLHDGPHPAPASAGS